MSLKPYLLIVFFMCLIGSVFAQFPYFQSYQLIRRKEPVAVNQVLQDRKGFIWMATAEGLFRFDGKDYLRYTKKDSLQDDNITCLAQDSTGRLWIGANNGTISYLEDNRFKHFEPEEGTSSQPVSDIIFDKKGNMWFGTFNDGLYYYVGGRLYRMDEQEGMPDLYVYDLAEDDHGNILAGTDGGIAICTLKGKKVSVTVLNHTKGLPDNIIRKIVPKSNKLWIATEDAGIISYDLTTEKYDSLVRDWTFGSVSDFVIDDGHFWITCPERGLLIVNGDSGEKTLVDNHQGKVITSVKTILRDREGSFWLGGKSGLFRTPGLVVRYFVNQPALDNNVLAVTETPSGDLWYSTNEGLFKKSPGAVTTEDVKPLMGTPYEKYTVISLYADSVGAVWAGLYGEGLLRIDPVTNKVAYFQKELNNGNILNVTGRGNVVWLATLGGATKITSELGKLTFENIGKETGLSSDFIYQILVDSKNNVWFSTDGKGVDMKDAQGFHHYESGLPTRIVYGLVEDGKGQIWANVQGNGLYRLEDGTFKPLSSQTAPREMEIAAIAVDTDGNIVAMHNTGIDIVDISGNRLKSLGDESGLREKIPNLNAVTRSQNGDLLFGTSSGIVKYAATLNHFEQYPLAIVSSVKIYDREFSLNAIRELSYDQDNLTFQFTGLWYQNPENVTYRFKLENYDRDWILTRDSYVTYSHLPPGQYVFKLKVSANGNFGEGDDGVSLSFVVHPPFWTTPPFYMICAAALVVGSYLFMRFRERRLMREKLILESKVRKRTMEVQRQNDEIQAQNEEIMAQAEEIKGINENLELIVRQRTSELERKNQALEEYAFINAHKLRSPVASILGLVHLISKTRLDDEGNEITKRLRQSAEELDDIVRSITRAIEKGEQDPVKEKD